MCCTDEQSQDLHCDLIKLDFTETVEQLNMYKAPGLDGIPNEFYYLLRRNEHLGSMLCNVFDNMVETGTIPKSMTETYYRLLYKKGHFTQSDLERGILEDTPHLLTNWRPIGLLCYDYKILYSAVASIMKPYLHDLVGTMQGAFIPGRNIQGNLMLTHQMIHYHNTTGRGAGLLFLDYAHAYDYVSQDYSVTVLETMNFPPALISLIALSMSDQLGRVIVNGDLTDSFRVGNGGKQGDPLFPYIYILALEGLTAQLELMRDQGEYSGVRAPDGQTTISTIGYADDTVIALCSEDDILPVERALVLFCKASGHAVKPAKSTLMWLGSHRRNNKHKQVAGVKPIKGNATFRHLGIQLGHKVSQEQRWAEVRKRINAAALAWRTRNCTLIGRTLVLNTILASKVLVKFGSMLLQSL